MEQYVKYLRKSRFDRDYADLSIEETLKRHEAILDKLASDRGFYVAKTYYEVVSGESIAARPEVQKLLEEVNAGIYAGVLVVDVERLARGNGADQAYISQVFQFSGTKIITPMKTYDPSNEFDEEYFEFGLFMSRREYKTINRRLIRGRESSASEGKYLGSIAPYGYDRKKLENEKGYTLTEKPEEAEVVRKIFSMYTSYNGTKIIANALNDSGVPTRHGELWTYSTVAGILANPVYIGKIRRGWCKQTKSLVNGEVRKKIKHLRNMEDYTLYPGLHPALISEEQFQRAQEIRAEKHPGRKVKDEFELQNAFAGLIYCACCGKRIGRTVTSRKRGAVPRFRCVNGRNCHNRSAGYAEVEREVIAALKEWLEGYKVKIDTQGFAGDIAKCDEMLAGLRAEKEMLQKQLDNAFDLVEQGVYTLDLFKIRREKIESSMDEVRMRTDQLIRAKTELEEKDALPHLIPQTEELLESYPFMTPDEKNKLLKAVLYRIEYKKEEGGKIEIDLYPRLPRL